MAAILEGLSINTQCTAIKFIRLLSSTTNFPEAKFSSIFLSLIFWIYSKTLQQQPENFQRLFRLQNCLSRKSATTRKYSKTFSPAKLSWPQVSNNPKKFKDFFACKIVLAANQQQPENIQRLFRLQNCLSRK